MVEYLNHLNKTSGNNLTFAVGNFNPRKTDVSQKCLDECTRKVVSKIFAQKDILQVDTLISMRNLLFKDILHSEFHSFNLVMSGPEAHITNECFAKSIIAFLSHDKASSYIKHLETVHLTEGLVSLKEYQSFHNFINFQKNVITQEIELHGAITYRKLKKLINELAEKDKSLTISKL